MQDYTTKIFDAAHLQNNPYLTINLCSLVNSVFQAFYTHLAPPTYRRIPTGSDLVSELATRGFILVALHGEVPIAAIGAKLWNPQVKVATTVAEECRETGDESTWEIIFNVVRQSPRYMGKGLAKDLLEQAEKECLSRLRECRHNAALVKCITRCVKEDMLRFYEKRGYKYVEEVDLETSPPNHKIVIATAEKLVHHKSGSEISTNDDQAGFSGESGRA